MTAPGTSDGGRATLKDVYEITGRVEAKVDGIASKLDAYTVTSERRFTTLEVHQEQHAGRLDHLEKSSAAAVVRLDKIEDRQGQDEAATRALQAAKRRAVDWRHWAIGASLTVAIILATVLPTLFR